MPHVVSSQKGVSGLYEDCCEGKFYDWVLPGQSGKIQPDVDDGYICMAPISYNDAEALTLTEHHYDPINEELSTWRIVPFEIGVGNQRLPHRPYKLFNLESDDDLKVVKCKYRPALVVKKVESDWRYPGNTARLFDTWLCLPLFSYKQRHSQQYVLRDQKLLVEHRFYFPRGVPGLDEECACKFTEIQFIPRSNLYPRKCMCDIENPKMKRPIKLTKQAFEAVLGHLASFIPQIEITGEAKEWYEFFKELVQEQMYKAGLLPSQ